MTVLQLNTDVYRIYFQFAKRVQRYFVQNLLFRSEKGDLRTDNFN